MKQAINYFRLFGILTCAIVSVFVTKSRADTFTSNIKEFRTYVFERNFDCAMIGLDIDKEEYLKFIATTSDQLFIDLLKNQYFAYVDGLERLYQDEPRIPKIIHQIWVGPHPFPQDAREWQATWKNLHPDWDYKLWTNEDVESLEFENKKYYNEAENWGEKADILRLQILYEFGGLYVDVDQKCYKSFDILHHTCDFFAGIHQLPLIFGRKNVVRIANGVIGAVPKHPIIKHAVQQIQYNRHHEHLLERVGPDFFTQIIKETLVESSNQGHTDVLLPANYFYPCGKRNQWYTMKPNAHIYLKPETIAAHYYASYWIKPPKKSNELY